jgi:mono/diheme cytochrome c family protein
VNVHSFHCVLSVLVALAVPGCGRPRLDERPLLPTKVVDFDTLFQQRCTGCHGADGKLGPAPPLNDPLFLAIIPHDELEHVAADGRPGSLMTAFRREQGGPLTAEQVEVVVAGIFAQWSKPSEKFEPPPPAYLLSAAPTGNKEAGGRLFVQICARCHGKEGEGREGHEGDAGPLHSAALLGLISNQALRRIVITGRPDLGMPDYRKLGAKRPGGQALSSREVANIVAFLVSWRLTPRETGQSPVSSSVKMGDLKTEKR